MQVNVNSPSSRCFPANDASSPPPGSHVIRSIAGFLAGIDEALKRYVPGVDEWRETMRSLEDAEDIMQGRRRPPRRKAGQATSESRCSSITSGSRRRLRFPYPSGRVPVAIALSCVHSGPTFDLSLTIFRRPKHVCRMMWLVREIPATPSFPKMFKPKVTP